MKYYVLEIDANLPHIYGEVNFEPDQGVYSNLWNDRKLPHIINVTTKLSSNIKSLKRDFFSQNAGFIGSEKFKNLLLDNELSIKCTAHLCTVFLSNGSIVNDPFYFMEFNCWVDAFDFERSVYEKSSSKNEVLSCSKLVINPKKTEGLDLFFIKSIGIYTPIISEKLAENLMKEKIKGIILTNIEEYSWEE